ncbi:unnamed protein product [Effrenium voratum]|uniref:Glutaredoxin domain-containing protein n=1 Tax=Effrenium voratum TaxID=2562239 RepID=A0AA36J6M4_9DINO|nr:unnamed protein product [Effrenium voratum]
MTRRAGLRSARWLLLLACVPAFVGSFHFSARTGVARRAKDDDRVNYMESPLGQFLGSIAKAMSDSPLNDAKIWFAQTQAGEYDEAAARGKLEDYIKNNKVLMFSFTKCPFCIKAKRELTDMGVPFTALDLDQMDQEGKELRAELAKKTKRTSMPNIFIAGQGIGGCNDGPGLLTLKKEGKLEPMLRDAGALA